MFARVALTAILAATLATAQRGGGGEGGMGEGGGRGGGMGGEAGMPRMQRQSRFDMFAEKLKLNKEQKEEVLTIFQAAMEEARPIGEQILKGREVIATAYINGRSEDDIKKMLDEFATISGQLIGVETKAFAKVYALLKPNQQSKAPAAFELMAGMFGGPAGGGRARGRSERN